MAVVTGAKAILYRGASIVCILRDDDPAIPFPNHWDLPGGGLEHGETAEEGVLREIEEELGLRLKAGNFDWGRLYARGDGTASHFFATQVSEAQIAAIRLGDEGQCWCLMDRAEFVARTDTVPHFRPRVAEWFAARGQDGSI